MANEFAKAHGYTCFDYFTYKGMQYPLNTVVRLTDNGKRLLRTNYRETQLVGHYMFNNGNHCYEFVISWAYNRDKSTHSVTSTLCLNLDEIIDEIIIHGDKLCKEEPKQEYYKDHEVEGVLTGWIIYIVLMFLMTAFNGFLIGWLWGTIYFFSWRKKKLKKQMPDWYGGYKYHEEF